MSACGAEFGWSERDGVVCRLAVHSSGDHVALLDGVCHEYDGSEGRVEVRVTWPQVTRDAASERVSGACGDEQGSEAPGSVRGRERRTEARGANEGEV